MQMGTTAPKSEAIAGDLYKLLATKLPVCCNEHGVLQIATLADRLNMSHEGVYRWLRSDEISKRGRKRVIEIFNAPDNLALVGSNLPLTENDLRPFS
jgi:hypothetical protein